VLPEVGYLNHQSEWAGKSRIQDENFPSRVLIEEVQERETVLCPQALQVDGRVVEFCGL